jgi:hypothetical protein
MRDDGGVRGVEAELVDESGEVGSHRILIIVVGAARGGR